MVRMMTGIGCFFTSWFVAALATAVYLCRFFGHVRELEKLCPRRAADFAALPGSEADVGSAPGTAGTASPAHEPTSPSKDPRD